MIRVLLPAAALTLAGSGAARADVAVTTDVILTPYGQISVSYSFDRPVPAVLFPRSEGNLRAGAPLATAVARGAWEEAYACGAVLAFIADAAIRQRDGAAAPFAHWRALIAAAQGAGGTYDAALWLATLSELSGARAVVEGLARYTEAGVPDLKAHLAQLFGLAGVPFAAVDGRLVLGR